MKVNIVICDDDRIYREALRSSIQSWSNLHQLQDVVIVRNYASSEDLLEAWQSGLNIDIAFLDIQIPGEISGLELAKVIRKTNEYASIVFVTNYSEYAYDGYSVNALRYLQKPICDSSVYECLDIAYRQWKFTQKQFLYIDQKKQKFVLLLQHILYIEAAGHRLLIHTVEKDPVEYKGYIKDMMEKLSADMFVQCHRSYIVNILFARSISQNHIIIAGNHSIPIGRKYMDTLLNRFKQYYQGATL